MELMRALGALAERPEAEHERLAGLLGLGELPGRSDHTGLFVLELPPYASVYVGSEGMLGGLARDRVAGFWRALGQTPPAEPDHLTALLGMYAALGGDGGARAASAETGAAPAAALHARRALFWEHLASWLPAYLERVAAVAAPAYRRWAELLGEALAEEAHRLGPPDVPPLHLREAPPALADADPDDLDALVDAVLTPVRTGVILTRADLGRAAREVGAGARVGERRFVLRALLGQDAAGVLGWLGREAERRERALREWGSALAPVTGFWAERAAGSAGALARMASQAARER